MRWSKRNRNRYYKSKIVQHICIYGLHAQTFSIPLDSFFVLFFVLCKARRVKKAFFFRFYPLFSRRPTLPPFARSSIYFLEIKIPKFKTNQRKKGDDERELEKCTEHKGCIVIAIQYARVCAFMRVYGFMSEQVNKYVFR